MNKVEINFPNNKFHGCVVTSYHLFLFSSSCNITSTRSTWSKTKKRERVRCSVVNSMTTYVAFTATLYLSLTWNVLFKCFYYDIAQYIWSRKRLKMVKRGIQKSYIEEGQALQWTTD